MKDKQHPAPDELEVSIFGPGYGEAIILHVGDGKWLLVDSCLHPDSGQSAPLKYLYDLNVALEQAVRLVVATHWHDDHIRGISKLLEQCESAQFVISNALRDEEFWTLASLYQKPSPIESSGMDEFSKVLQLIQSRRPSGVRFGSPKFATADRLLYHDWIEGASEPAEVRVSALSPSDASMLEAHLAFSQLVSDEKPRRKRVASPKPNHASVVIWVEVGHHKILLGADLERTSNPRTGWSAILSESTVVSGKAGLFKIPHHGSENAHHEGVWTELLLDKPFALVSSFCRGKKPLPCAADVERLVSLTPYAYATAPTKLRKIKWRDRVVRDHVDQATRRIYGVRQGWGHVRLRKRIDEQTSPWQVELFGDAVSLTQ